MKKSCTNQDYIAVAFNTAKQIAAVTISDYDGAIRTAKYYRTIYPSARVYPRGDEYLKLLDRDFDEKTEWRYNVSARWKETDDIN